MNRRQVRSLHDELARHTYKPGYTMRLYEDGPGLRFELTLVTADSYHPDRTVPLCFRVYLTPQMLTTSTGAVDVEAFTRWLAHVLHQFEIHEAEEWHRRDGRLVTDPHAERTFGRPG